MTHRDKLAEQMEDLLRLRQTDVEALMEQQAIQYEARLHGM